MNPITIAVIVWLALIVIVSEGVGSFFVGGFCLLIGMALASLLVFGVVSLISQDLAEGVALIFFVLGIYGSPIGLIINGKSNFNAEFRQENLERRLELRKARQRDKANLAFWGVRLGQGKEAVRSLKGLPDLEAPTAWLYYEGEKPLNGGVWLVTFKDDKVFSIIYDSNAYMHQSYRVYSSPTPVSLAGIEIAMNSSEVTELMPKKGTPYFPYTGLTGYFHYPNNMIVGIRDKHVAVLGILDLKRAGKKKRK